MLMSRLPGTDAPKPKKTSSQIEASPIQTPPTRRRQRWNGGRPPFHRSHKHRGAVRDAVVEMEEND